MYKFRINEQGFYDGYGSDGTIPMSEEFNLNNLPTDKHKHNGITFVLDDEKVKQDRFNEICKRLDEITESLVYNKARYGNLARYAESYEQTKIELIAEQETLADELDTLK